MKYEHLFFDLDHTLWDFDTNAKETLLELFDHYELEKRGVPSAQEFIDVYTEFNHQLWRDYHNGVISKEVLRASRFKMAFEHFGLDEAQIPHQFEIDYVNICPTKTNVFPGAHEVLETLMGKYKLHIITNGFLESQQTKMKGSGLDKYFDEIFVSEVIGMYKPDVALFHYALGTAKTSADKAIMIGDSLEADVLGARNAGIDQVFFNPHDTAHEHEVTYEIKHLKELLEFL